VGVLLPHSYAAMRLGLSNPDLVPELLEFLESRVDVVTKQVSDNEVELSLLGSYNEDAAQMTVDLLVRAWQAGRADEANVERSSERAALVLYLGVACLLGWSRFLRRGFGP
jgi:hypothetical protein